MIENRGAVLGSEIGALAIELRRIVILPKHIQQDVVRDFRRIVIYFHGFGVAGSIAANIFVGGILEFPAGVADTG